ncbi:MAG: efflux RND transporter periplasmic adaptor subunit [Betaproteobacteria bacterium]
MNTPANKRFNFNKKYIYIILGLVAIILLGYVLYSSLSTTKKKPPEIVQSVVTTAVVQKDFPVIIETSGNVVANNIVDIRPQVANVIAKIHIKDGQEVKAGDLLFTLDDRADKANFEKFKALADDAERQYNRAQELAKQNFISQASVETAMANANSARAAANASQVTLSYDYIRSPISGRAGVINVFPGSLVSPSNVVSTTSSITATTSQGAMVTISQLNPINVQFTVPEVHMAGLMQLQKSAEGLIVTVDIGGGITKQGKVYVVDNQIDTVLGSVRVKATLDNSDYSLAPGRFVHVNLQTQIIKDALIVPSQSIISNSLGDLIYTVDTENKTVMNKVKILTQGNGSAVVTGLKVGDRVVVEGKQNIRPGLKVAEGSARKVTEEDSKK